MLTSQEKRSRLQNKDAVLKKMNDLLVTAFKKRKIRKPVKPGKAAIRKRLEKKKQLSEKKERRRKLL
jgi:ribosome-associated protein